MAVNGGSSLRRQLLPQGTLAVSRCAQQQHRRTLNGVCRSGYTAAAFLTCSSSSATQARRRARHSVVASSLRVAIAVITCVW